MARHRRHYFGLARLGEPRYRLRLLRVERRMTQLQLAWKAGMSVSLYSQIERGHRDATPGEQAAIARVLDRPVDDVFTQDSSSDDTASASAARSS